MIAHNPLHGSGQAKVSTHHRPQPLALFENGFVHAPLKLSFHRIQLRLPQPDSCALNRVIL